jgi:hypothetical protein
MSLSKIKSHQLGFGEIYAVVPIRMTAVYLIRGELTRLQQIQYHIVRFNMYILVWYWATSFRVA